VGPDLVRWVDQKVKAEDGDSPHPMLRTALA
jgi:hypothetical protein